VYTDSNDAPVNLTGYTAAMQLRQNYNSEVADLTLTTANGGISIVGATGTITITATAVQTGLLDPGFYVYDLELTSGSNISRLIQGQLTVAEQVTR
jgi:phage tail sheath gpL-like